MAGIKRSRLYCAALAVGFYYTAVRRTSWSTMMNWWPSWLRIKRLVVFREIGNKILSCILRIHAHVCVFTLRWSPWWTRLIELSSYLLQVAVDGTCLSLRGNTQRHRTALPFLINQTEKIKKNGQLLMSFYYIMELNIKSRQESVLTRSLCNHTSCALTHQSMKQTRSAAETAQWRETELGRGNYSILDLAPGST